MIGFLKLNRRIVLASASPRRRELLLGAGLAFDIMVSECDETLRLNESPEEMVRRLSREKAQDVESKAPEAVIIGADTTVVLDGEILGKPSTPDEAFKMIKSLQGRQHTVVGGFTLLGLPNGEVVTVVSKSEVSLVQISDDIIRRYVATGEPMDKAGSYAVQGIGSQFISKIVGSYTNVVGLDLSTIISELRNRGVIE